VELQTTELHTEKLQAEVRSLVHPSGGDTFCIEASDIEESEKPTGMWAAAVSSAAPHVRSSRKPLLGDIAIGVLSGEPSNLILDLDNKGKYEVTLALYSHLFPSYGLCRLTPCEFWTGL
jgi:hypothetical protein